MMQAQRGRTQSQQQTIHAFLPLAFGVDALSRFVRNFGGLETTDLVAAAVFGLLGGCAVISFTLFAHALYRQRVDRVRDNHLERARALLAGGLIGENSTWASQFRKIPRAVQHQVMVDAGRALAGADRDRLIEMAGETDLLSLAERDCHSKLWWHRLPAARLFATIGGGTAVMPSLLDDPHRSVRIEAIRWAEKNPSHVQVPSLLPHLGSPDGIERAVTVMAVAAHRDAAVAPLASFITSQHGLGLQAALQAAEAIGDPALIAPSLAAMDDEAPPTRQALARFLANVASPAGEGPLMVLLRDQSSEVRVSAARGLAHLRIAAAVPMLAQLMADEDRDSRHAAGLALRAMGGPGLLTLRRVAHEPHPRRSRLAKAILRLPADATMEAHP